MDDFQQRFRSREVVVDGFDLIREENEVDHGDRYLRCQESSYDVLPLEAQQVIPYPEPERLPRLPPPPVMRTRPDTLACIMFSFIIASDSSSRIGKNGITCCNVSRQVIPSGVRFCTSCTVNQMSFERKARLTHTSRGEDQSYDECDDRRDRPSPTIVEAEHLESYISTGLMGKRELTGKSFGAFRRSHRIEPIKLAIKMTCTREPLILPGRECFFGGRRFFPSQRMIMTASSSAAPIGQWRAAMTSTLS